MSDFKKQVNEAMRGGTPARKARPSYPAWSLAHYAASGMAAKGSRLEHPSLGTGTLVEASQRSLRVQWDSFPSWARNSETIDHKEASIIVVLDDAKYKDQFELSEEVTMKKIDMTGQEYLALMEDGMVAAPAPSQTILTKQSNFSSSGEKPLSTLDGDGGANPDPREEGKSHPDAMKTPSVQSMDDPSRKARIGNGNAGAPNRNTNSTKSSDSKPSEPKSSDTKSDSKPKSSEGKPWEKKSETDSEDSEMKKKNESFTFEDADFDSMMGDDMGAEPTMEHDMAAGEIAVTKEFLVQLLQGVVAADLKDEHFSMIADAIADCCSEDRTLDVGDIGEVMSSLKGMVGGQQGDQMGGQQGGQQGDQLGGQQGQDMDLMEPVEECDDEDSKMEGKLPDALKKHMKGKKDGQQDDEKEDVKESRRSKKAPGRKPVKEAWMGTIPGMSPNSRPAVDTSDDSDEAFIANIKRLAGMR